MLHFTKINQNFDYISKKSVDLKYVSIYFKWIRLKKKKMSPILSEVSQEKFTFFSSTDGIE